ncbi:hypothetical protein SETIT_9G393800v2 [Setaria italica]|uniref:O-fucosyltransferase family protein n=1 Tax=Setaria italica TaxID=4555 RepID=K4AB09_SETIT|nr:uncharacterized protein LOC101756894 [Setaria italica]RCV44674.1 hypothetical protein SETIT_9G393800v2 [Setaria italica]
MAIPPPRIAGGGGGRKPRIPPLPPARTLLTALAAAVALAVLCLLSSSPAASLSGAWRSGARSGDKYLYWGGRVDCPGKHCGSCAGLGHQESSLRCALEEALFLGRVFVMPSRMCLSSVHNTKGVLQSSETSKQRWEESSCAMESLYDIDQISRTVPVILDNSKTWHDIVSKSVKLEVGGVAHVQGISRGELKQNSLYSTALIINRTASPLAWFMECKDRKNRSSVMLSYTFLPSMPAKKLRDAANKMKEILDDYDAIHVRRGDLLKNRKDRFGVERSLHPHLDRDTRPEYIRKRIAKWIPPGRTLYIASNERTPGFFSSLSDRYKLAYSSNFSSILEPVIENNYQLFMVERLIMQGAKTFVKTMREFDSDLTLCDDPKKNTKVWQRPVYTDD